MIVTAFTVGPLGTNCYLVSDETGGSAVLVDPGGVSPELLRAVAAVDLTAILLTHGHFDHIAAAEEIAAASGVPIYIHERDRLLLDDPVLNGSFMIGGAVNLGADTLTLAEGDTVPVGSSSLRVVETPGHSPGSVTFIGGDEFVICGDVLFRNSVGRWDLPGGDYAVLERTLARVFLPLPESMVVYPGHGDETTIGHELRRNPFLRDLR